MPWYKVKAASQYAGISERLYRDWLNQGLRHVRMPSGLILTRDVWIDEYLQSFEVSDGNQDIDNIVAEVMDNIS
jgi:hypothetical protein